MGVSSMKGGRHRGRCESYHRTCRLLRHVADSRLGHVVLLRSKTGKSRLKIFGFVCTIVVNVVGPSRTLLGRSGDVQEAGRWGRCPGRGRPPALPRRARWRESICPSCSGSQTRLTRRPHRAEQYRSYWTPCSFAHLFFSVSLHLFCFLVVH